MLSGWEGVGGVPQLRVIFSDLMSEKWWQYTPSQLVPGSRGSDCQADSCREILSLTWIRCCQGHFLGLDYSCPNRFAMLSLLRCLGAEVLFGNAFSVLAKKTQTSHPWLLRTTVCLKKTNAPFLEAFWARLDGALSSLILRWNVCLLWQG